MIKKVTESDILMTDLEKSGGFNLNTLSDAVEHAVVVVRFRDYEKAVAEVDKAVRDIMEGSTNISTQQIIWNRKINTFLRNNTGNNSDF